MFRNFNWKRSRWWCSEKQLKITRIVQVLSWVLHPDCSDNSTAFNKR